jgi:hypothetical protein
MSLLTGFLIGLTLAAVVVAAWRAQKPGGAWLIAVPAIYLVAQDWLSRRFTLHHLRYETVIAGFFVLGAALTFLRGRGLRWTMKEGSFPGITREPPPTFVERAVAVAVCLGVLVLFFATITSYPPPTEAADADCSGYSC